MLRQLKGTHEINRCNYWHVPPSVKIRIIDNKDEKDGMIKQSDTSNQWKTAGSYHFYYVPSTPKYR